jgi:hypothetical protein
MNPGELIFILVLATILLALAAYFGRRQIQVLRSLPQSSADPDERRYLRSQAQRRLFCSFLMVVFAAMLLGWIGLNARYLDLLEQKRAVEAADPAAEATQEEKDFGRLVSVYLVVALLVLLGMVSLAIIDFWAIARFGLSQQRRLHADRRALLEEYAARRRRERNGDT